MIYFTSDTHFDHANVIKYCNRPFKDTHDMNEHMIRKWNEMVSQEDTIYHLGDFSLSTQNLHKIMSRLNGTKILIAGNHDKCHPANYKDNLNKKDRYIKLYLESGFSLVLLEAELTIAGHQVKLCHLPYTADHTEKIRHQKYRPVDTGQWLLCGHIHQHFKVSSKQINVGVDVWDFTPVSILEIEEIIKTIE